MREISRGPLLYNIWDRRNEGVASGVEEWFMQMGLFAARHHSREIVWVMLVQRAARVLASLYLHANEMTMEEACTFHRQWTARQWMDNEPELLRLEQQLYLRQHGYGTSNLVGKYLIEKLIMEKTQRLESAGHRFVMREFFQEFNDIGCIPVTLMGQ